MAPRAVWPRNMRKLCIFHPHEHGTDFFKLRNICRPLGQLVNFKWDSLSPNAFATYNTEDEALYAKDVLTKNGYRISYAFLMPKPSTGVATGVPDLEKEAPSETDMSSPKLASIWSRPEHSEAIQAKAISCQAIADFNCCDENCTICKFNFTSKKN